jgi:hypothetical protein
MNIDTIFILLFGLTALSTFFIALRKCKSHEGRVGKPYKVCELYGSFLWMDHIVLAPFWVIISFGTIILNDSLLFLLILSTFWLIRSIGETIYWFLQQFHPRPGNEPEKFWINKLAPGQGVWFLNQLFWQCVSVLTLISTVYLFSLWL